MASLEEDIRAAIPDTGTYSVIVETSHHAPIRINAEAEYEMASISKLSIALVVLEMIESGELSPYRWSLELKEYHKRKGTGILRYFGNGFILDPQTALQLLLMESDNTAANLLLEKIGGQSEVNSRMRSYGFTETGLADRDDNLFESDVATAEGMFTVFEHFIRKAPDTESGRVCLQALKDSHFVDGFRRCEHEPPHNIKIKLIALQARFFGFFRQQGPQANFLTYFLNYRTSHSQVLSKEGMLPDFEGRSYLHEIGCFHRFNPIVKDPLTMVAVFSSGTPGEGYSMEEAKDVLARIGEKVYQFSRY